MIGRESVSVVIPCFNAEATVGEAIESALRQTWHDIEIIVVDDGSDDGSAELLRGFGARIRIESGPNRGASAARNRGTALATGAYVQYLDADDLLAPEAIERRLRALTETGADVAYSDWQRFEESADGSQNLGEIVVRHIDDVDPDPEIACATFFWAPPVALLYRRRIIDAIGEWNERLPVIQDARFLFEAARRGGRFVHVPGVSAFYRHLSTSLSRGNEAKFMLDVYRNAVEIQSLWEADGTLTPPRKRALAGIFDMTARSLFRFHMPEFDDAVNRLKAVSKRHFGYPEIAQRISRLAGHDVAVAALGAITASAYLAREMRSIFVNKR
jgi:glycosyltransferase involved in cell wall biosynthesis